MIIKYSKLETLVLDRYGNYSAFGRAIGQSRQWVFYRLTGQRKWTLEDVVKVVNVLNIDKSKVWDYFFAY